MGRLGSCTPGWMTVVTPTDCPRPVRSRCVINGFGGVFVLSIDCFEFSIGISNSARSLPFSVIIATYYSVCVSIISRRKSCILGYKPCQAFLKKLTRSVNFVIDYIQASLVDNRKRKKFDSVLLQKQLHKQNIFKSKMTTEKRQQNFDYTMIADQLRTASGSNDNHPTSLVKTVYGIPTFPLTTKGV